MSLKQGKILSHKPLSPAQPERTLCLGKKLFQVQGPLSFLVSKWQSKDYIHKTRYTIYTIYSFPINMYYRKFEIIQESTGRKNISLIMLPAVGNFSLFLIFFLSICIY